MSIAPDPITQIEPIVLRIPFDDGGKGHGIMPTRWNALDIMMLRVETASGLVGWGEGFGYLCQHVTARAVKDMITPFAMGRDSRDPAQLNRDAQLALHLFGRFGITMFAISALDIALWDIAAKREGLSLGRLLGGRKRNTVQAYASLVRYGTPEQQAYLRRVNAEHENILDAIRRQDPEGARAAMRTHLANSKERRQRTADTPGRR